MIDYAEGDMAPGQGAPPPSSTAAAGSAAPSVANNNGGSAGVDVRTHFDPSPLLDTFEKTITFLHGLNEKVSVNVRTLEEDVKLLELKHETKMKELENQTADAFEVVDEVEISIKRVSSKVVHVGEQLNAKKLQRERAQEARTVIEHFEAFEANAGLLAPFSTEKADLHECAAIIQKLNFIS